MGASIDYISYTFTELRVEEVLPIVQRHFPSMVAARGHHGYKQCWRSDGAAVYFDGMPNMGVHVQISGVGCAILSNSDDFAGWGPEFDHLFDLGAQFTRVDMAFDDRRGITTMDRVRSHIMSGQFLARWKENGDRLRRRGFEKREDCLYLGLASSPSMLCIYDKQLQQISVGEEDPGHWVRFELRLKKELANSAAKWISAHPNLEGIEGILKNSITFIEDGDDSNKSRRKTSGWWEEFLQHAAKVALQPVKLAKGLQQKVAAYMTQHAATFEVLRLTWAELGLPGSLEEELRTAGAGRLKDRHRTMVTELVNRWRTEKGFVSRTEGVT